ncbi:MAG: hypothetical protein JJT89_01725 [Nitriliruptoraceae bacterium]|nr:hypothetical protein [Nitriliruptoraceae bacterium]
MDGRGGLRARRDAWRRFRRDLRPGERAWRGASTGLIVAITAGLVAVGTMLTSGRGIVADAATAIVLGWVAIGLAAALLLGVVRLLRWIPARPLAVGVVGLVAVGAVFVVPGTPAGLVIAAVFLVSGGLVGAAIASLRPPRVAGRRRVLASCCLGVGVLGLVAVPLWLGLPRAPADENDLDPTGPHAVRTVTYGSGEHPHRAVFGAEVDVVTQGVDGTAFLDNWSGWRGNLRTRYWGFGPDRLPRNATVWLPERDEPSPLVLMVHGNHPMEVASDEGYAWLAEDLASHGYVVASVDQTFLNVSVTRGFDLGDENDARAWMLLEHLRLWEGWQREGDGPLSGTVDLDRIALIGHSRGGEAVAHAALFDRLGRYPEDATVPLATGFGIDAVIAIAPIDGQYAPAGRRTTLDDVSYLTLHGGRDGDVSSFVGLRQYERTTFSGQRFASKAALYLEDANHGQFNTVWGRYDLPGVAGRLLETDALVPGRDQRLDARTAITAFLGATLRDDVTALEVLAAPDDPSWSGTTRLLTRTADSTQTVLADFREDVDPTTATLPGATIEGAGFTVWREEPVPLRWGGHDANGVVLGWESGSESPPTYTIRLPDTVEAADTSTLVLDIADARGSVVDIEVTPGPIELSVELVDVEGAVERASLDGGVPTAPAPRRLRSPLPDAVGGGAEGMSQTFRVAVPGTLGDLREVRLVFEPGVSGAVRVERIALGR